MTRVGSSWKLLKPDYQFLEDTTASPDIMWSSTQTGCGPLQRLLMDVESISMHQPTPAISSTSLQAAGMSRSKATSAPAALFSKSSSSAANSTPLKLTSMKRIRSGPHVFGRQPTSASASEKKPQKQSQSLELLGDGKLGTEILARVSHSLNERAISRFANSQKQNIRPSSGINSKQRAQLPLQSQSNTMLNRCHHAHLQPSSVRRTSINNTRGARCVPKSPHIAVESSTSSLKDSPQRGRLKALLREIDREKTSFASDHNTLKVLPMRAAASSQRHSKALPICESAGLGQPSDYTNQDSIVLSDAVDNSGPPPPKSKSNRDVRTNTKLVGSRKNNISSPAPIIRPKRSYRIDSPPSKTDSISPYLAGDEDKVEYNQPTIGTAVQDSLDNDDIIYNEENSSSSYGDIGIDASLLEEVCKEYDI